MNEQLTFEKFAWAAFIYWAQSYYGNIGGDNAYSEIMKNQRFLRDLRNYPDELSTKEIGEVLINFLNQWRCRLADSQENREAIKQRLVRQKEGTYSLSGETIARVNFSKAEGTIQKLYTSLREVRGFGPTTTSKVMHVLNPELFVMWDNKILDEYNKLDRRITDSPAGYVQFLRLMQELALQVEADFRKYRAGGNVEDFLSEKLRYEPKKYFANFVDEFNWITYTKGMDLPPPWSPTDLRPFQ